MLDASKSTPTLVKEILASPFLYIHFEFVGLNPGFPKARESFIRFAFNHDDFSRSSGYPNDREFMAKTVIELMTHVASVGVAGKLGQFAETGFDDFRSPVLRDQPVFSEKAVLARPVKNRDHRDFLSFTRESPWKWPSLSPPTNFQMGREVRQVLKQPDVSAPIGWF